MCVRETDSLAHWLEKLCFLSPPNILDLRNLSDEIFIETNVFPWNILVFINWHFLMGRKVFYIFPTCSRLDCQRSQCRCLYTGAPVATVTLERNEIDKMWLLVSLICRKLAMGAERTFNIIVTLILFNSHQCYLERCCLRMWREITSRLSVLFPLLLWPPSKCLIQDWHAVDEENLEEDKSQDYQLLSLKEDETFTIMRFKRYFQTCDPNDLAITVMEEAIFCTSSHIPQKQACLPCPPHFNMHQRL